MAGRKANRNDPKNVAKRRAAKKEAKEKRIKKIEESTSGILPRTGKEDMTSLTGDLLDKNTVFSTPEPVKPVGEPGERVEGGSVVADIPDEKPLTRLEQKKKDAEGRLIKRRSKTVLNRLDRKTKEEAASLYTGDAQTPDQIEATNAAIEKFNEPLAEMPGSSTEIPKDEVSDAIIKDERTYRQPAELSDRTKLNLTPRAGNSGPGIFIPFTSGSSALPLTRPEQPSDVAIEDRAGLVRKGMDLPGSEKGLVKLEHPRNSGNFVDVPKDVADAHELYLRDYDIDPEKANMRAMGESSRSSVDRDEVHPLLHSGVVGGYQTQARVTSGMGLNEDQVKTYAKKMGLKYVDVVTGLHNIMQDQKASSEMQDANQFKGWSHPDDMWVHPETGELHRVDANHPDMPKDDNGNPVFMRSKGTLTGFYRDKQGGMHTTNPEHLGWNRIGEVGKPGVWNFKSTPAIPEVHRRDGGPTTPVPMASFMISQVKAANDPRKTVTGSVASRDIINKNASSLAALMGGNAGTDNSVNNAIVMNRYGTVDSLPEGFEAPKTRLQTDFEIPFSNVQTKPGQGRGVADYLPPIDAPMADKVTGTFGVDQDGNPMPQPFKVGRKGNLPRYIRSHRYTAPEKRDPIKIPETFVDRGPDTVFEDINPQGLEGPKTEFDTNVTGKASAIQGRISTPWKSPGDVKSNFLEVSPATYQQDTLPGLGIHSSNQFLGMPTKRVTSTVVTPASITPGTENELRSDPKVYKRGGKRTEKLVSELQNSVPAVDTPLPSDPTIRPEYPPYLGIEMSQQMGKVTPATATTTTNFEPTEPVDKEVAPEETTVEQLRRLGKEGAFVRSSSRAVVKRDKKAPKQPTGATQMQINWEANVPEEDKAAAAIANHASGRQWLGAVGRSDENVIKAARSEDVFSETRARPVIQNNKIGRQPVVANITQRLNNLPDPVEEPKKD